MDSPVRVLYVEDNRHDQELVVDILMHENTGFDLAVASSHEEFTSRLASGHYDIVLSDFNILGFEGLQVIAAVHEKDPQIPVVILTGTGSEEIAVAALKKGAADYVIKTPRHIRRLPDTILAVLERCSSERKREEALKELSESEERLAMAQRIARIGNWTWNIQDGKTIWSDEVYRIFGVPRQEPSYELARSLVHPDDLEFWEESIRKSLNENLSFIIDYRAVTPDGRTIWIHNEAEIQRDAEGRAIQMVGTAQDITIRKNTEEIAARERSKLKEYFECLPIPAYNVSFDGIIEDLNRTAVETLGYDSKDELVGKPLIETIYAPESREKAKGLFRKWKKDKQLRNEELQVIAKDGRVLDVLLNVDTIMDHNGKPVHSLSTHFDVTARNRAEKVAMESAERIRLMTETIEDVFWISTPGVSGHPYVSSAYEKVWGQPLDELEDNPRAFMDAVLPEDRDACERTIAENHTRRSAYTCEYRIRRPDGEVRWILEQGFPIVGENGEANLMTGFCKDVTERKRAEEELRRSEAALNAAQAIAKVGSWEYDIATDTAVWSDELFRIFGRDPSLGEPSWAEHEPSIHPEDWQRIDGVVQIAIAEGTSYCEEFRVVRPDGSILWVEAIGRTTRNGSGSVTNLSGTMQNIDRRKRAEEALRKSEEKYRLLMRNAGVGIGYYDIEGRLQLLNRIGAQRLGGKPEDFLGKNLVELFGGEDGSRYLARIKQVVESGKNREYEDRVALPVGAMWLSSNYAAMKDEQGKVAGVQVISHDITESKQAGKALRRSEEKYRKLVETINAVIVTVDREGYITFANRYALEFYGYKEEEELLGEPFYTKLVRQREDSFSRFRHMVDDLKEHPYRYGGEPVENIKSDGSPVWVQWVIRPLLDENEDVSGVLGIGIDVTDQKESEEALLLYQERLRSMAALLSIAEQHERKQIAQYLHDEIAQSLIVTRMKIESARESAVSSDVREILEEACSTLNGTIKNTRNLTFELSPPVLHELGLGPAIEQLAERMSEDHGFMVDLDVSVEPRTWTDDVQVLLYQAVRELLMNIVKHSDATRAKITMTQEYRLLKIIVADNGKGFDPEGKHHSYGNSGFGLFSLKERLQHVGGALKVESKPGEGTKVIVTTPTRVLELT